MNVTEWLAHAAAQLHEVTNAPADDAMRWCRSLACHVLACEPLDVLRDGCTRVLSRTQRAELDQGLKRLCTGEPLSRVFGKRMFWEDEFDITLATLDPRPETEGIITQAQKLFAERAPARILELGVGSGCLLLSLLRVFPKAYGVGTDISQDALKVAWRNAQKLALEERVTLHVGNWWQALAGSSVYGPTAASSQPFDLIVSNPPYICSGDLESLEVSVRAFDPHTALDGGPDGLNAYREIAQHARAYLRTSGWLILEVGANQALQVSGLLENTLGTVQHATDLSGHVRYVSGMDNKKSDKFA